MVLTEQALIWAVPAIPVISVRPLSAQTVAVNVWAETLFLAVRGVKK